MSAQELKPCPFCGGKGMMQDVSFSDGRQQGDPAYVKCIQCHARVSMWDKYDEATAAWNRRTDQEKIAALEAERDAFAEDCRQRDERIARLVDGAKTLRAERDALADQNARMREALKAVSEVDIVTNEALQSVCVEIADAALALLPRFPSVRVQAAKDKVVKVVWETWESQAWGDDGYVCRIEKALAEFDAEQQDSEDIFRF